MKHKKLKYIGITILLVVLIATGGIFVWTQNTYKPTEELYSLVKEADYVKENDFYVFTPKGDTQKTGIVMYPGALVEPLAYGYYAKGLSEAGYLVAIADVKLNLSITESDKANEFIEKHPEIEHWYVGGHSMGGVSATLYAEKAMDIDGIVLLGSYPSKSTDLSGYDLRVLSLYGEKDGLTSLEEIEESKKNLPQEAEFVELVGGNHAQFGMYGNQKGDQIATIDVLTQQNQMIEETINFLEGKVK